MLGTAPPQRQLENLNPIIVASIFLSIIPPLFPWLKDCSHQISINATSGVVVFLRGAESCFSGHEGLGVIYSYELESKLLGVM